MSDWKSKTLVHWDHINNMARRRFATESLAEEAALFVIDSLEKNNWQKIASFQGKSSFKTYLSSITYRLLEDFSRKKFGRIRPPLWIRKLGGIWSMLFEFLCLERQKKSDAVESTVSRVETADRQEIENAALHLLAEIPNCGSQKGMESALDEDKVSEGHSSLQTQLEEKEKELLLSSLFLSISDSEKKDQLLMATMKLVDQQVSLTGQERLLLKLCYQDGMRVSDAGKLLGLNRHQVHGRLRRLLGRLRDDFIDKGIDAELLQLLED